MNKSTEQRTLGQNIKPKSTFILYTSEGILLEERYRCKDFVICTIICIKNKKVNYSETFMHNFTAIFSISVSMKNSDK